MKEIDEFEYIQRWERSKFSSEPGAVSPEDMALQPDVELNMKAAVEKWPHARRALGVFLRRGRPILKGPKDLYEIYAQYQTNFGFLLVIDEGSLESSLRVPFGQLIWNGLHVCLHYRSMDDNVYESLHLRHRGFRFVRTHVPEENYDERIVGPLLKAGIVDDHSIQIGLRDGSAYRVTVMDNAKKGRMYNWFSALFRRQYPAFVVPSHIRVKRLKRSRKFARVS